MGRGGSEADRFGYEKEHLLLIGDWYHPTAEDVLAWYQDPGNFGNEVRPVEQKLRIFTDNSSAGPRLVAH